MMAMPLVVVLAVALVTPVTAYAQAERSYKVLATSKTSTMQKEMQEAGDSGYRFVAAMGGGTGIGGKEVVVLMEKAAADRTKYSYRLLATSKASTLQKELQEAADAGWEAVGQTVFSTILGGIETAGILERMDDGCIELKKAVIVAAFVDACKNLRLWNREKTETL